MTVPVPGEFQGRPGSGVNAWSKFAILVKYPLNIVLFRGRVVGVLLACCWRAVGGILTPFLAA